MRGREVYTRFRIIIRVLELCFRLVPFRIKDALWTLVSAWRGRLGMLIRYLVARTSSKFCGEVVLIGPDVEIRNWDNLSIGSNVSIQRGCYLDAAGGIEIGNDVSIAHNSSILSSDHRWDDPSLPIRENDVILQPVRIENDVWIGCGVRVLSGTVLGERSVVAAGAVVVKNVDSHVLVGGVPARIIKRIDK